MTDRSSAPGGEAAAGGFNFQAALGAIAYVHVLRGTPVNWTTDWTAAPPAAVAFETRGPGDDIRLELADGTKVEVQAKKRISATPQFWSSLHDLLKGVATDRCDYGILAVGPLSSNPVKRDYAQALHRLGSNSLENPSTAQTALANRLHDSGIPVSACSAVRIKTVSALTDVADAVGAAKSELGHVCADTRDAPSAWNALYHDAMEAISNRERRALSDLISVLRASDVDVSTATNDSPAEVAQSILEWTKSRTENFQVLGIPRPLPTDRAWLPLRAFVRDGPPQDHASLDEALAAYHAIRDETARTLDQIDARTIGTFRKLCVIVGGPGSGKSLLLDILARDLAKDSIVGLRVRLRDLATRVSTSGCTVEEGLLALGLDGSDVQPHQFRAAQLSQLAILCDGLDECGDQQFTIAASLRELASSHPSYRVIVTTRPFGYVTSELRDWRHYEIAALVRADVPKHLEILCRSALGPDAARGGTLRERIGTHLAQSNSTRTLARAPLLLGFAAALFLRSEAPSRSRAELYAQIFSLIDETPVQRRVATQVPARAVRDAVLNHVGWLTVASPLLASREIESRCADRLQVATGDPPLRALSEVQQSIHYWEHAGLVERLRHGDFELIAFVHKTCGEFAAARHLSDISTDQARTMIRSELNNPDSLEILDFATQTPLATAMAEMLVAEFEATDPDTQVLDRLFRILARPETSLSPTDRTSFLESVFNLALLLDRRKAYRAGLCLARSDLSRLPEAGEMAKRLLSASAEWSRLIGWAVLACHFPDHLVADSLDAAVHHFARRSRDHDFFVIGENRPPFGPLQERGVFEQFLFGASKRLLEGSDAVQQDRTIALVRDLRDQLTAGFVWRFDALLEELDRGDAVEQRPSRWGKLFQPIDFSPPADWDEHSGSVLGDVVSHAFLRDTSAGPPATGLKFLAAFLDMAGVLKASAGDIYVWPSASELLPDVHVALREAAFVFALPADRLAHEAKYAIELIKAPTGRAPRRSLLHLFPDVDSPEVDWCRARKLRTDLCVLERLVHHPSAWLSRLATLLLHEQLDSSQRKRVCKRILAHATGDALHWGAAMAAELPEQAGYELILGRLAGTPAEGLHHLFRLLTDAQLPPNRSHRRALETGLLRCDASTAAAAALWCQTLSTPDGTWLECLLRRALDHWLDQENTVFAHLVHPPGDPRESLLHALCAVCVPDPELLAELSADDRHPVARAAIECITHYAAQSAHGRIELVGMIANKRFSAELCDKLIHKDIPFNRDELEAMAALRHDADPALRVVALRRVLARPGMNRQAALATARSMTQDGNANVRDAAYRLLDESPDPV